MKPNTIDMKQLKIYNKITARDSQSINSYLKEISKIPLLDEQEELELARRSRKGDEQAIHALVKGNLRFVVSVAKQYQNQGLPLNDLINEGNIGLIRAVSKFDETKGFKFISYAVWWIRQSILQALTQQAKIIRMPMNKIMEYNRIRNTKSDFMQEHERLPTLDELAELVELKKEDILTIQAGYKNHISTDQNLQDHDDMTLLDTLHDDSIPKPDTRLDSLSRKTLINKALNSLSEKENLILIHYFGLNELGQRYNLEEIAKRLSMTRERVRQLKNAALNKIRQTALMDRLRTHIA